MAGAVGRPRKHSPRRRGRTAREEILDAAAELFTTQGFAATSTHQIADAVGIRQASLYYHFPSKTEIFLTLLTSTIEPSMRLAGSLGTVEDMDAPQRLWSLVAAEAALLLSTRWNVGRLYQLPVAASSEFESYHRQRAELHEIFRSTTADIIGPEDPRLDLPFHLALTAVEMRSNTGELPQQDHGEAGLNPTAVMLADAALTVIGAELPGDRVERTRGILNALDNA